MNRASWGVVGIVVGIAAIVFFPVLFLGFINFDDPMNIVANSLVTQPSLDGVFSMWTRVADHIGYYMPLTSSLWAALVWLGGGAVNPAAFHGLNLFLHLCNVAMVFVVARYLTAAPLWSTALGALVFALHPIQVEAVAWASATNGLLAVLFGLLSGVFYFLSRDWGKTGLFLLSLLFFILAFLSKPIAVVVPPILFVVDILRNGLGKSWRATLFRLAPWMFLVSPFLLVSLQSQETDLAPSLPLIIRPLLVMDTVGFYLKQLLFPKAFFLDYSRSPDRVLIDPWTWLHVFISLVIFVLAVRGARKSRTLTLGFAIFFIALIPVTGLLPFRFQSFSGVTDRYLYPSMVGVALIVVALIQWLSVSSRAVVGGVLVAMLAIQAAFQVQYWKTPNRVYLHCLKHNQRSVLCNGLMASHCLRQGDAVAAIHYSKRALAEEEGVSALWMNYGIALYLANPFERDRAMAALRQSLELEPTNATAQRYLKKIEGHESIVSLRAID